MNMNKALPTEVVIYTDGGVEPNPGRGGWAAILICDKNGKRHEKEITGSEENTTNNRMEILAMLEGLKSLKKPVEATVYTDSQYLQKSIGNWLNGKPVKGTGWIVGWRSNDWSKKTKGDLKNTDLWIKLWIECERHKSIQVRWVRGHSGDHYNERCDILATEARLGRGWDIIETFIMDHD